MIVLPFDWCFCVGSYQLLCWWPHGHRVSNDHSSRALALRSSPTYRAFAPSPLFGRELVIVKTTWSFSSTSYVLLFPFPRRIPILLWGHVWVVVCLKKPSQMVNLDNLFYLVLQHLTSLGHVAEVMMLSIMFRNIDVFSNFAIVLRPGVVRPVGLHPWFYTLQHSLGCRYRTKELGFPRTC